MIAENVLTFQLVVRLQLSLYSALIPENSENPYSHIFYAAISAENKLFTHEHLLFRKRHV